MKLPVISPDATELRVASDSYEALQVLENQLIALWEEILERPRARRQDTFFDLGGDSLSLVTLSSRLERDHGVILQLESIAPELTVESLARQVRRCQLQEQEKEPSSESMAAVSSEPQRLVALHGGGQSLPIAAVHPSGGSVLCYLELAKRMGATQPFWGVQGTGLDSDRSAHDSVESMAAAYLEGISAVFPGQLPLLTGYSFGGIVAYEMARLMVSRGSSFPGPLVLFDTRPPGNSSGGFESGLMAELGVVLDRHEISDEVDDLEQEKALWDDLAKVAERHLKPIFDRGEAPASETPSRPRRRRRMGAIQQFFFSYRLFPAGEEFDYRRVRRFLRCLQSNLRFARSYCGGSYPGDVVLFQAGDRLSEKEAPASVHQRRWAELIQGRLRVIELPANHFDFLSLPVVEPLAKALRDLLRHL